MIRDAPVNRFRGITERKMVGLRRKSMKNTIPEIERNGHARQTAFPKFARSVVVTTLEYIHPTAATISVAGTFNDWRPGAAPMISLGAGRWIKALTLPPGTYEYRLVVDGQWMPDPRAVETTPNPFGGFNSVLRVPGRNGKSRKRSR